MNVYSAKRVPDRRRRATSMVILTLLLLVGLLPAKAVWPQDVTNTGTVHGNETTTGYF